eukprot:TRINITY_DN5280_c0_g1_i1.p1 TRINITY_DN5280_c0_g1~~TRINITY_DN5280_c0_g1_i1.p1  ORF type:complete len:202 (-),score=27.16 TRINITY_DN5280_c0_g1_i1:55-660(-)
MMLRRRFLRSVFCLNLAIFQAASAQVLDLWSREEDGGGQGPVTLCPVDMNETYPASGYCADFVNYRYCPGYAIPQPNSDMMVWVVGEPTLDAIARASYIRFLSSVKTKHPTVTDDCERTVQALSCFYVYPRAADSYSRLAWGAPCRSVCQELKSTCWVQESCQLVPAGGCTSKSAASSVRPPRLLWLLFISGLLSLSFVLS